MSNTLSPAQFRARMKICREAAESGKTLYQTAESIGITITALSRYLRRHNLALRTRLSKNGYSKPKRKVPRDVAVERLKLVVECGFAEAGRRYGISRQAMQQWVSGAAPDGPRAALEKLGVVV